MSKPFAIHYATLAVDDVRQLRAFEQRKMKTINWTDNTAWEEAMRQAEQGEVLVMRGGHAVALLMPFDDDDLEWYGRERDPKFFASLAEARRQVREGQTMSHEAQKTELGLK